MVDITKVQENPHVADILNRPPITDRIKEINLYTNQDSQEVEGACLNGQDYIVTNPNECPEKSIMLLYNIQDDPRLMMGEKVCLNINKFPPEYWQKRYQSTGKFCYMARTLMEEY